MTQRHDRTGELIGDEGPDPTHDDACHDGWLPDDYAGRPVPCLVCKPHLSDRRQRFQRELDRALKR